MEWDIPWRFDEKSLHGSRGKYDSAATKEQQLLSGARILEELQRRLDHLDDNRNRTSETTLPSGIKNVRVSEASFYTAASTRSSAASFHSARSSTTGTHPSRKYVSTGRPKPAAGLNPESRTPWQEHLESRKLVPDFDVELNWSGRGQHAEYSRVEIPKIPLLFERIIGESATARVDSVRCRRIRLARKTVQCSRRMTREDVLKEVEHLQQLQHPHIVRLIGTYTTGSRNLSVLIYPVAEYNLEQFLATVDDPFDDYIIPGDHTQVFDFGITAKRLALQNFFACLAMAVEHIHILAIKHMDIKPKNILVRFVGSSRFPSSPPYTVLLADFGIAKSYASASHAETDGPTSFTRKYSAPEVVAQSQRGLSADIFSLGCVFVEMCAILSTNTDCNALEDALYASDGSDGSYSCSIPLVLSLLDQMSFSPIVEPLQWEMAFKLERLKPTITQMLSVEPAGRPSISVVILTTGLCKCKCSDLTSQAELEEARDVDPSVVRSRHHDFVHA